MGGEGGMMMTPAPRPLQYNNNSLDIDSLPEVNAVGGGGGIYDDQIDPLIITKNSVQVKKKVSFLLGK